MTSEEYQQTLHELQALAMVIQDMDLASFLERIEHAESIGAILDPTAWIRGNKQLTSIKSVASAAYDFQQRVQAMAGGGVGE